MTEVLKSLYIQSEISRITKRIKQYNQIYHSLEIKDLNLKRLITNKQREIDILDMISRGNNQ